MDNWNILIEMYSYHFLFFSFSSFTTAFFFLNLSCTMMMCSLVIAVVCMYLHVLLATAVKVVNNEQKLCLSKHLVQYQCHVYTNMKCQDCHSIIAVMQVQWYAFNILECCSIFWNEYLLNMTYTCHFWNLSTNIMTWRFLHKC